MDFSTHQSNIAGMEQKISSLESDIQEYVASKHPKTKIQLLAENDFQLTQLTTQLTQLTTQLTQLTIQLTQYKEKRLILLRQQQTQQETFTSSALIRIQEQLDEISSSTSSNNSSNRRKSNQPIRDCILARDGTKCVICGEGKAVLDGSHIIPHTFASKFSKAWETYEQFLYNREHGVADVRNGVTLCANHHRRFDKIFYSNVDMQEDQPFTIIWDTGQYYVAEFDKEIPGNLRRGQLLRFGTNTDIWPHQEFLKFHSQEFCKKLLCAAAESVFYGTDTTLVLDEEDIKRLKVQQEQDWREEQTHVLRRD